MAMVYPAPLRAKTLAWPKLSDYIRGLPLLTHTELIEDLAVMRDSAAWNCQAGAGAYAGATRMVDALLDELNRRVWGVDAEDPAQTVADALLASCALE